MIAGISEAKFNTAVVRRDGLILVDCWAPWCAPCRALMPVLEDLAADFGNDVTICKVDMEAEQSLRDRLRVTTLPTLLLYRDGAELDRVVGTQSRARLSQWLEAHL